MSLPLLLQDFIEKKLEGISLKELQEAASAVSSIYHGSSSKRLSEKQLQLAYLVFRLPATFAVVEACLDSLLEKPDSILDLGGAIGAARFLFEPTRYTVFEQEKGFVSIGKELDQNFEFETVWKMSSFTTQPSFEKHDLALASYSMGEVSEEEAIRTIEALFSSDIPIAVLIEPGTPVGFERIFALRKRWIELGGFCLAPCTHSLPCPYGAAPELYKGAFAPWCHFSKRISRSALHKRAKKGSVGFEDEKYCYVILTKATSSSSENALRVISAPIHEKGQIHLPVCSSKGLSLLSVQKRDKERYTAVKRADWGDKITDLIQ